MAKKKDKKQEKHRDDKHRDEIKKSSVDHSDEIKRLNRVMGQVEGVRKMLDEQRDLGDVLVQCKAIHSALKSIETRILRSHLEVELDEIAKQDKRKSREQKLAALEELFKHAN